MLGLGLSASAFKNKPLLTRSNDLIKRMSVFPTSKYINLIDQAMSRLVTDDLISNLDVFSAFTCHDYQAAKLNWVNTIYNFEQYNGVLFTANRGVKGLGNGSAYMAAVNYVPSDGVSKLKLNDASLGIWILTHSTIAGLDAYLGSSRLSRRNTTSNDYHYRIQDGTSTYFPTYATLPGLFSVSRKNSTEKECYYNGSLIGTISASSDTFGVGSFFRLFNAGSSDSEIAFAFCGSYMNATKHLAMYNLMRNYLLGAGLSV